MRNILAVLGLCLGLSLPATAQTALSSLQTGDDARGWEAVGRLDIEGKGFCTGALIAPDLVLTAAHCLYDRATGERIDPARIEFQAGLRNGRAEAYRDVRRAVTPQGYEFSTRSTTETTRQDIALLELSQPIRLSQITPFETVQNLRSGMEVGVVSYAHDRAEAPALQEVCAVLGQAEGVLVLSCDIDFGSSGAPIFVIEGGVARIVSVVSAKADLDGERVALGTSLDAPLAELRARLEAGDGVFQDEAPRVRLLGSGERSDTGAKFVQP